MERSLQKAVVLGSGVMGAAIAAHLANSGLSVLMLDRKIGDERLAQDALKQLPRQKPNPLYSSRFRERIRAGSFEEDIAEIGEADWVIEAIVEQLEPKQKLLEQVERHWRPGTIVSSNTSGLSIAAMARQRSDSFKRYFMGTHFFNPPRYMKLVELIPTESTDAEAVNVIRRFCETRLGKSVVIAKDTPNFIANRIGTYGLLVTIREMTKHGLSVSAVDALTGPLLGRPKSATFRTLDMVGLDTFAHVAGNVRRHSSDPEEQAIFELPELLREMVKSGQLGEKAGRGFYQVGRCNGEKVIEQWDAAAQAYVPRDQPRFPSLEAARLAKSPNDRIAALISTDDPASRFVWSVLKKVLLYSAARIPEIADDPLAVDQAMRWGFNWDQGPFETWDMLGVQPLVERMRAEGESIPAWVEDMLAGGRASFYVKKEDRLCFALPTGGVKEWQEPRERLSLRALKEKQGAILSNPGASLIDLGDGVACLEFHSASNAVGPDILELLFRSLEEVRSHYRGLVIANEGKHFCVGANLMLLLMEAQDENWAEIERMISQFQNAAQAIKYFELPIVSAPFGMTLGGGVELAIPAACVQAAAETYMGLVETGVGLIPAGGGTKELLLRFTRAVDFDGKVDLQPFVNRAFETIGLAKVSTSGQEAKELGYLRPTDRISVHRDDQLYDAKKVVLALADSGYDPPERESCRVVGEPGKAVLHMGLYQMKSGGHISDHDERIGRKLAHVLTGGQMPAGAIVSEQYLLDLEREAFLSLCGEPKSQARMQHMLLKGKPLRN